MRPEQHALWWTHIEDKTQWFKLIHSELFARKRGWNPTSALLYSSAWTGRVRHMRHWHWKARGCIRCPVPSLLFHKLQGGSTLSLLSGHFASCPSLHVFTPRPWDLYFILYNKYFYLKRLLSLFHCVWHPVIEILSLSSEVLVILLLCFQTVLVSCMNFFITSLHSWVYSL